jgi:hypothetical protein
MNIAILFFRHFFHVFSDIHLFLVQSFLFFRETSSHFEGNIKSFFFVLSHLSMFFSDIYGFSVIPDNVGFSVILESRQH